MLYLFFKTVHVVGFVSWFAGLFYLGRMFVYHVESFDKPEPARMIISDQIFLMENRVYSIIMNPAMIVTWFCGLAMLYLNGMEWLFQNVWLHFKLFLLILLTYYHFKCGRIITSLGKSDRPMSSIRFRLFNEIPTVFLILIATLAVYKNNTSPVYLVAGIFGIMILLYSLTMAYKKVRKEK